VLIKINQLHRYGISHDDLYETTRKWWRLSPRRAPDYAFAVVDGVVQAVYAIDRSVGTNGWTANDATPPRWSFTGARSPKLEALYRGKDISAQAGRATNPIRFANC
jgi:hypothetical protein